jgi:hypothetical protein
MAVNNNRLGLILIIGFIFLSLTLVGCAENTKDSNIIGNSIDNSKETKQEANTNNELEVKIDKLEIYHFHGTNQCYSCITMGDYAEETVKTYFKEEVEKGIIVFEHINGELPENRDLVIQYGATGSSLWLGTYKGDDFKAEQNTQVWYKIQDKEAYMTYLKGVIEQKLAGN